MRQAIFATVILIGFWTQSAYAQNCPAVVPVPANETDIACYTNKPVNQRCATAIEPTVCAFLNNTALSVGLITQGGFGFLRNVHFCAVVADMGTGFRVFDFCPEGCFAGDTEILTELSSLGGTSYRAAELVTPKSPMVSLADGASFDDVSLTQRSTKRIVRGPEDGELYVFALSNGRTLRVTTHHPMVLDNGQIIAASKVAAKMSFVGLDGQPVAITAITREQPTGDVYNFETGGDTQMSHIIVAEGVLVGDLKIQNELSDEQGAIDARR